MLLLHVVVGGSGAQEIDAAAGGALAPPPPRSIDVRVWVTRPHVALLEFPMSPNTSAFLLEGEQGVYYRWQSLIIAQVRVLCFFFGMCLCVCFFVCVGDFLVFWGEGRLGAWGLLGLGVILTYYGIFF